VAPTFCASDGRLGPEAPAKSSPTLTPFAADDGRVNDLGRAASTDSEKIQNRRNKRSLSEFLQGVPAVRSPLRTVARHFGHPRVLSPVTPLRAGGPCGRPNHRGEGMRTQFEIWTSRARGLLADALEYSQDVMALVSERTHLEALPAPDEPLLSWSVYLTGTPAKWLGTVEGLRQRRPLPKGRRNSSSRKSD